MVRARDSGLPVIQPSQPTKRALLAGAAGSCLGFFCYHPILIGFDALDFALRKEMTVQASSMGRLRLHIR